MKFRRLSNDADLELYRHKAHAQIDVLFPLEYLKRSTVVGCFDRSGDLVAGYMLVRKGPFRVLESVPDSGRTSLLDSLRATNQRVSEITGLWIAHRHRGGKLSGHLWMRLYRDMILSGKTQFVYAYTLKKTNLGVQYAVARPMVIFRGETGLLPGMNAAEEESVEVFHLLNLMLVPFRHPGYFADRFRFRRGVRKVRASCARFLRNRRSSVLSTTSVADQPSL